MEIIETGFNGLLVIKPAVFADNRGYFFESFSQKSFKEAGLVFNPVQDNESKSTKGVIRGLHYQLKPYQQAKLVRVVEGRIYDVVLDLRKKSPAFGRCFGVELDSESKCQLLVPSGFAHGFSVLSDTAVIQYKVDNLYDKMSERGIALNDPVLKIDWLTGGAKPVISEKDLKNPLFSEAEYDF
ncbi:MAG: dTDP-4-dehydrorhamnose 3,5-epimerase [Bacteroidales bacterium]|jgi:dTDP-4-dehydrorhamnose 3,5-epimerase